MMPVPSVSAADLPVALFIAIPLTLAGLLVWATHAAWRRAGQSRLSATGASGLALLGAAAWMSLTWDLASRGVLLNFDATPPPFAFVVLGVFVLALTLAFSRWGMRVARHIPLSTLVAVQAFRLPLELAMHAMHERGVMPQVMSYTGRNFDILTGLTAILVAAAVANGRGGRWLVLAWNLFGLALLVNIIVVAILATPRFRYFGDDQLNVWVMNPPFVWLPAVMVLAALAGHLVIFRALQEQRTGRPAVS